MNYDIVVAQHGDIQALLQLESLVFMASDGKLTKRAFSYHIRKKNLLLLAKHRDSAQLLGYILVLVHRNSARVYSLAVHPSQQKQGIARALLTAAFDSLSLRHIYQIRLELRTTNLNALRLYESLGFKIKRVKADYYGKAEDALQMERCLNN